MKVLLDEKKAFEVTTESGASLGLFVCESEWENMQKLVRDGECIIVGQDTAGLSLAVATEAGFSVNVVAASPSLIGKLRGDVDA